MFVGHLHVDTADLHTQINVLQYSGICGAEQCSAIQCQVGGRKGSSRDLVSIRGKSFPLFQCFKVGSRTHQTRNGTGQTVYGICQNGYGIIRSDMGSIIPVTGPARPDTGQVRSYMGPTRSDIGDIRPETGPARPDRDRSDCIWDQPGRILET
jgi:hypothetical protein